MENKQKHQLNHKMQVVLANEINKEKCICIHIVNVLSVLDPWSTASAVLCLVVCSNIAVTTVSVITHSMSVILEKINTMKKKFITDSEFIDGDGSDRCCVTAELSDKDKFVQVPDDT